MAYQVKATFGLVCPGCNGVSPIADGEKVPVLCRECRMTWGKRTEATLRVVAVEAIALEV